jgi:hypothetical protein
LNTINDARSHERKKATYLYEELLNKDEKQQEYAQHYYTRCRLSRCRGLLQNKYDAYELKSEKKKRNTKIYTYNRKSCRSTLSTFPQDTAVPANYPAFPSSSQAILFLLLAMWWGTATQARHHQRLFKQTWKIKLKINLTKKEKTIQWLSEI